MKINFTRKDGEKVMEIDSSKEKDVIVLDESLVDLASEESVTNNIGKAANDDSTQGEVQ